MSPELFVGIDLRFVFTYVKFVDFTLRLVYHLLYFDFPSIIIRLICTLKLENSVYTTHSKKNQELNISVLCFDAHLLKVQNPSRWFFIDEIQFGFVILQSVVCQDEKPSLPTLDYAWTSLAHVTFLYWLIGSTLNYTGNT